MKNSGIFVLTLNNNMYQNEELVFTTKLPKTYQDWEKDCSKIRKKYESGIMHMDAEEVYKEFKKYGYEKVVFFSIPIAQ